MQIPFSADPISERRQGFMKKEILISGLNRRSALTALSQEQRMKYEIAQELGLLDRVKQVGWAGLTAKESGKIGGVLSARKKQELRK